MTVTAVEDCYLVRAEKRKMLKILPEDPEQSMAFITYLLSWNLWLQEDLVDHFFNRSEKRLARLLLSLARYEKERKTEEILSENQPADARGNGGYDTGPSQSLHEQISEAGTGRLQRAVD